MAYSGYSHGVIWAHMGYSRYYTWGTLGTHIWVLWCAWGYSQWVHLGTPGIHVGLNIVMSEKTHFTKTKTAIKQEPHFLLSDLPHNMTFNALSIALSSSAST